MKQTKLNVLAMHERVLTFLKKNDSIWQSFEPMLPQVDALRESVERRRQALAGQQVQTQGATTAKSDAQLAAIDQLLRISKFANAYALAIHNTELYAQTMRSRSYLRGLPDDQALAVLRQMHGAIEPYLADLQPYGVTPAQLTEASQAIDKAQELRNAPRSVVDTRKTAGSSIPAQEQAGRQALKVMDKTIHFFDDTHPKFVAGYRNARIIIDDGVRHDPNQAHPPA